VPTFVVIVVNPWHFYRRLPQILQERKPWYKTPLAFFATQLIYALILLPQVTPMEVREQATKFVQVVSGSPSWVPRTIIEFCIEHAPKVLLTLTALSAPLWMIIVAACMAIVTFIYEFTRTMVIRVRKHYLFPILNPYLYIVPLDPLLYTRLCWSRFFWGLFYFGLLAAATAYIVTLVFVSANGLLTVLFIPNPFSPVNAVFVPILWVFQRTLITPYVCLLRSSSKAPSLLMHKSDGYVVNEIFRWLALRKRSWRRDE
jgi:hypothetical protein